MEKGNGSVVWTTGDLRNSSTSWTLEGDRALLGILENIHKNLISQTKNTADKLDRLNTELCRTSVSLKNVNNRFMGLSNTQFMESSVQEDDVEIIKETVNNTSNLIINHQSKPTTENKEAEDVEKKEALLQCISTSCRVLEGLCEKLHISPDSDSESDSGPEDMAQSIILRPKDNYSETPLPHIIGSQRWQKKWHIGLHDCSSESDSGDEEKLKRQEEEAHFSSSEESQHGDKSRDERLAERKSQMSLPIPKKPQADATRSSMTSTSTNNSSDTTDLEVAKINSTLKASLDEDAVPPPPPHQNIDDVDSVHRKAPQKVPNASEFAAELARKLGGNIHSTPNATSVKNEAVKTPHRKTKDSNTSSNRNRESKVPGYDPGLSNQPAKRVTGNIFLDEPPPLDTDPYKDDDLFGDGDDEDDDGLFSTKPTKSGPSNPSKSTGLFGNKQSNYGGLFDDLPDDDDFVSETNVKHSQTVKKSSGFFDESDDEIVQPKTKTKGLFDDSDDDFFAKSTEKSKNTNIKSNARSSAKSKGGFFDESSGEYSGFKDSNKNRGLFDDNLEDFDSTFETKKKIVDNKNVLVKNTTQNTVKSKGLFDDDDDDSDLFSGVMVGKLTDKKKKEERPVQKEEVKKLSLFGDESDDDEDLFASLKKNPIVHNKPISIGVMKKQTTDNINEKLETKQQPMETKAKGLFGETIDTEPEDLFAPLRIPEKKLTDVKKPKESTSPHDGVANKESLVSKKLLGAVSTIGNNPNTLREPNSVLSIKRKDSSSSESDKDSKSPNIIQNTRNQIKGDDEKKLVNTADNISESKQFAVCEVKSGVVERANKIDTKEHVKTGKPNEDNTGNKSSAKSLLDSNDSDDYLFGKSKVIDTSENNEPIKVQKRSNSLFDDVPPPLDDEQPVSKESRDVNSLFDYDDDEDLFSTIRNITKTTKNKMPSGLFDDLPQEDDLSRDTKKPSTVGLFFDEPPDLDDNIDYGDKDEPVVDDGESNMFADYPYYKSVNIIKNSDPKIEDGVLVNRNVNSNVKEVNRASVVSDQTSNIVEIRKSENTIPVLSDSNSDLFDHSREKEVNKLILGELSDDEGDLFSSLLKVEIPKESSNIDNTSSLEEPKKLLASESNLNVEKDLDVKLPFEVSTDPSIKVFVDISKDKSKVLKEEIKSKPDVSKSKVTKPEILKSKPEIRDNKPEFLFVKPNSETKSKVQASSSDTVENKLNLENYEAELEPDSTEQKPKIINKKPEITGAKSSEYKPEYRPEISSKPVSGASDTLNMNTNVTDAIEHQNLKPEIKQAKPKVMQNKPEIKQEKPEIRQDKPKIKPEIKLGKPEIEKGKLEIKSDINLDTPEIKQGKTVIEEIIKPVIKQDKPDIKQDKPNIKHDKPEIKHDKSKIKQDKPEIKEEIPQFNKVKSEIEQNEPEINQEKTNIEQAKPEVPIAIHKQEIISEIGIVNSISELINKVEKEQPKLISKEETNLTGSSSINDIKAALSKKATEVVSKSSLDVREEIDGNTVGLLKSQNVSKSENTSPAKAVGKLQMNLNINVKALIPGGAPKLVKEINEERRGSEPFNDISKGLEAIKSVSFDEEPKSLDSVLSNSLSKDRVKIPVKRRPSSRRARQEAVRKSAADILFSFDETDKMGTNFTTSLPTSPLDVRNILDADSGKDNDIMSSLESNRSEIGTIQTIGKLYRDKDVENYIPSSEEYKALEEDKRETNKKIEAKTKVNNNVETDDIFDIFKGDGTGKHQEISDDLFNTKKSGIFVSKSDAKPRLEDKPKKSSGLFGVTNDDLDLFPGKETKKPAILFADESDEDLFSTVKPKESAVQKVDIKKAVKSQGAIRKTAVKSVFNDSDSDSDLFASKTRTDKGEQKGKLKSKGKSSDSRKQTDVASKNKLFGDSDSEDELFFKPPTHGKGIGSNRIKSKSLFDDEGADDVDIFNTNKGDSKMASTSIRPQAKQTTVVLSSAELTTQDPLSSFWDD